MASEKPMPLDFLRLCLERRVKVQLHGDREVDGVLHAYDEHCNLVVGDVQEILVLTVDNKKMRKTRTFELLYIRGDRVVTISPLKSD